MNLYKSFILPALLDRSMGQEALFGPRRQALATAAGKILEIGFGSGANLPHYPDGVVSLHVIEPDGQLAKRALPRILASGRQVHAHPGKAEDLPFADASFDTIVSSFTLCSVSDPEQALREVARVLRPGGRFLFLEHGLCPEPGIARWQRRLNPLQKCLGGGCHLTRDMEALIQGAPFAARRSRSFFLPKLPKIGAYLTLGQATARP
ncbi:class I SAM-dependent methyltransferase [Sphingosinicella rhizophila]|uniref:Class I SAM-dependent methyltransferase n=1 Tax=Sphingosinicella rhizophila TaxID=3050082 RepID=A0ABU3QAS8_9SPHN|nr:class I SAM-dependent methyltransferase [Sphingosinicella sp. GR2756]MDT9600510.1 class I SAM-dependent methyltransferase [Sphingosinicella sp. GR2756]